MSTVWLRRFGLACDRGRISGKCPGDQQRCGENRDDRPVRKADTEVFGNETEQWRPGEKHKERRLPERCNVDGCGSIRASGRSRDGKRID